MPVGVALIHAEEIASEQRRLLSAGAGAEFEDRALLVGGVLRQKLHLELPLKLLDPRVKRAKLLTGERRHFGVGGRIVDELLQILALADRAPQRGDGGDDGIELGEFARQAHIAVLIGPHGQGALHRLPTGDELVELIGWDRRHDIQEDRGDVLPDRAKGECEA